MTDDDALHVQILSGEGGMQNELKITEEEDLQVAVEALQLAARYQFGEGFELDTGPDQEVDQLAEQLSEIDDNVAELIQVVAGKQERFQKLEDRLYDSQKLLDTGFSEFQKMKETLEDLSEMLRNQEHVDSPRRFEDKSEGEPEAESGSTGDDLQEEGPEAEEVQAADGEEDDSPDLSRLNAEAILEEDLVEVDVPYSYDEFKDLSDAEKRAVIYDVVQTIQPATKVEVADHILESDVTDSNGKRAQYVGYRLENKVSNLSRRRRPTDQGKDPWEFAESGFGFEEESDHEGQDDEDVEDGSGKSEETQGELDLDKSQLPDDSADDTDEADSEEESEEGAYGFEWMSVDEAVEKYKEDKSTKFLLCIRSMKSYTSPMLAEKHAEEDEGEVWAVTDEHPPDDFVQ